MGEPPNSWTLDCGRQSPAARNRLAAICSEQRSFNISYSGRMDWAQVSILLGVASFAAIVLFVMYRKPHA